MEMFLGKTIEYWMQLEGDAKLNKTFDYFTEVVMLRAKVYFYESRLDEMNKLRSLKVEL